MRRIKAACLEQTVQFLLKDGVDRQTAQDMLEQEYADYKENLKRSNTRYRILEEDRQPDGSLIIRIIKQYNGHDCGAYLN